MEPVVLFVSPYSHDAAALNRILGQASLPLDHVRSIREARTRLARSRYTVVLTEAELADGTWQDVLRVTQNQDRPVEVIVTHPFADAGFWTDALRNGAFDVLAQPFQSTEVLRILEHACQCSGGAATAAAAGYFG